MSQESASRGLRGHDGVKFQREESARAEKSWCTDHCLMAFDVASYDAEYEYLRNRSPEKDG